MTSGRRLVVMRHAKAETFASTDHARRLTDRGRGDAADAGAFLAAGGWVPDHALVSTAARARETWDAVRLASGATVDATYDDAVYLGSEHAVLECLRLSPEDAANVVFVGHNPTAAALADLVEDGDGDPAAENEMLLGFPTAALAVLDVPVSWADLDESVARLLAFHVGRSS